jgi:hypothetical protein
VRIFGVIWGIFILREVPGDTKGENVDWLRNIMTFNQGKAKGCTFLKGAFFH